MKRTTLLALVLVTTAALVAPAALASRRATTSERTAILKAVVRQKQLTREQASCQIVTVSTVNHAFADLRWPRSLSSACRKVAANGVIVEQRKAKSWRFVAAGSAFRCPVKGVPAAVARDLGVCP